MADPAVYAVAILQDIAFGSDMTTYLRGIDATLEPYGGRFVVHHPGPTVKEGELTGRSAMIILTFPDRRSAEEWYDSPAYQQILPLRTANSQAVVALLADGVPDGYTAQQGLEGWLTGSRRGSQGSAD